MQVTINVCVFVFDLLYVDGESLVHFPLRTRRDRMSTSLAMRAGYLEAAQALEFPPHLTPSGAPAIESVPIKPPSATPADLSSVPGCGMSTDHCTAVEAPSSTHNRCETNADDSAAAVAASPCSIGPADLPAGRMQSEAHADEHADKDMTLEPQQAEGTDEEMRSDDGDVSGGEAELEGHSDAGSHLSSDRDDADQAKRKKPRHHEEIHESSKVPATAPVAQVGP